MDFRFSYSFFSWASFGFCMDLEEDVVVLGLEALEVGLEEVD